MQSFKKLSFGELNGWNQDDHDKALGVFSKTQSQFRRNLSLRARVKKKEGFHHLKSFLSKALFLY